MYACKAPGYNLYQYFLHSTDLQSIRRLRRISNMSNRRIRRLLRTVSDEPSGLFSGLVCARSAYIYIIYSLSNNGDDPLQFYIHDFWHFAQPTTRRLYPTNPSVATDDSSLTTDESVGCKKVLYKLHGFILRTDRLVLHLIQVCMQSWKDVLSLDRRFWTSRVTDESVACMRRLVGYNRRTSRL